MKSGERQVKDEDGYFTEVAVRLNPGWRFAVALSDEDLLQDGNNIIRLGGEGHRALVSTLEGDAAPQWLEDQSSSADGCNFAYLLTPGLAQATADRPCYAASPWYWPELQGCATDRPLYWGGVSRIWRRKEQSDQKTQPPPEPSQAQPSDSKKEDDGEFALLPQRAFVPPGTVYAFDQLPGQGKEQLLPLAANSAWLETFHALNYGKLLWGKR